MLTNTRRLVGVRRTRTERSHVAVRGADFVLAVWIHVTVTNDYQHTITVCVSTMVNPLVPVLVNMSLGVDAECLGHL